MRLIDADAVLDRYYADWEYHCITMAEDDRQWLRQCIDQAPTIDAVPVVHGRWIPVPSSDMVTGKAHECSECQKMRFGSFKPNYCPNCGAKMDGDNDAENH